MLHNLNFVNTQKKFPLQNMMHCRFKNSLTSSDARLIDFVGLLVNTVRTVSTFCAETLLRALRDNFSTLSVAINLTHDAFNILPEDVAL